MKDAHGLGKEKPSDPHKHDAVSWSPREQHGRLWELGIEPVLWASSSSISELVMPLPPSSTDSKKLLHSNGSHSSATPLTCLHGC